MADLKSFAQPTNTTLYTDVVDIERGFHAAHARLVHSDYASAPLGAVNLDNPGGATRSFTQWNGTAYAGVALNSAGGYAAPTYSLNLANCLIASNIGGGNPGFAFDSGDFMDYNRSLNAWRVVIGGVEKVASAFDTFFNRDQILSHEFAGASYKIVNNSSAPLDSKRWRVEHAAATKTFATINDANTVAAPYDTITRSGLEVTTRRLNETSGRLLVGQGLQDNGVSALQTTSYSASNQPSLTNGSGAGVSIAANGGSVLDMNIFNLKGGVILIGANSAIVAPVAGVYLLSGSVAFNAGASAGSADLWVNKNGSLERLIANAQTLASAQHVMSLSLQINLLANDNVSLLMFNNPDVSVSASATIFTLSFNKIN